MSRPPADGGNWTHDSSTRPSIRMARTRSRRWSDAKQDICINVNVPLGAQQSPTLTNVSLLFSIARSRVSVLPAALVLVDLYGLAVDKLVPPLLLLYKAAQYQIFRYREQVPPHSELHTHTHEIPSVQSPPPLSLSLSPLAPPRPLPTAALVETSRNPAPFS